MLPTAFKQVVAVSSINGFERTTSIQRCQFSAGTLTLLGTARQMRIAVMPLATPIAASDARQPKAVPINTTSGAPATDPIAQPIISFASDGPRSCSGTSMLTVAATCGV